MSLLQDRARQQTSRSGMATVRTIRVRRVAARAVWHVIMIVVAASAIGPLVYMILTSVRPQSDALTGPILPTALSFTGYDIAWNQLQIWKNFGNSVLITGGTLLLTITCATLAGYAFAKLGFTAKNILFAVVVSALFLPGVATLIPVYLELSALDLLGSRFGLVLVYTAGGIPFAVFLMRMFFEALPDELAEAGRVDGAGEVRIFTTLMMPLAAPGIATISIFQMINTWNELLFASALISDPAQLPIQPAARSLIGQYSTNWPALTAALTLGALPMIVAYIVFQRWFVAGLTGGALKG